jgi:type II secretory pathway component PulC
MTNIKLLRPWQKALVTLINYSMVALLAMTLAYWFWVFYKPSPAPSSPAMLENTQDMLPKILAGHWFSENNQVSASESKDLSRALKLIGVMSTSVKQPGFAVFKLEDGKHQHALLHNEIMPGVMLESIDADSVMVSQQGMLTKIELESR